MATTWPTLARAAGLEAIEEVLSATGGPGGVVIAGGAGVGKTTLAREAVRRDRREHRWVVGTESARTVPLGAFAHLVSVTGPIEPATVLRTARGDLLAGLRGMIIGVDDAHLLDNFSATLVHQLAMTGGAKLVVTIRDGEPAPDAVTALWKDEWLVRMELGDLTRDQTVELLEQALGGPVETPSADRIFAESEGNPMFLRHLIEGARGAGNLRQVSGVWQLRGQSVISPHLTALVEATIARHSAGERRVLELLAFSEPMNLDVLTDLSSPDDVEAAERDGLVRVLNRGSEFVARLGHPLYGEVVAKRSGAQTARRIRGEIVRREQADRPTHLVDQLRLAALALDSDSPPDPDLLVDAARDALRLGDIELGERLARGAQRSGGGFYAAVYLAQCLAWQGRGAEAEAELSAFGAGQLDEFELLQWGLVRASNLFWALGRRDEAMAVIELMYGRATERMVHDLIAALDSTLRVFEGNVAGGLELARTVLASPACPPLAQAWAAASAAIALAVTGKVDEVAPIAREGGDAAESAEAGWIRHTIGLGETSALLYSGQVAAAEALARSYIDLAEMQQPGRSMGGVLLSRALLAKGDLEGACRECRQAAAAVTGTRFSWGMLSATYLAQGSAALGRAAEAHEAIARAEEFFADSSRLFLPELAAARAWVAACDGDYVRARELAATAGRDAEQAGQPAAAVPAYLLAAQFGDATVADPLVRLAAAVPGPVATLAAELAVALRDGDGIRMHDTAARFEVLGMQLVAADCYALAARALAAAGNRAAELSSAAAAQRLATQCGRASTPALSSSARSLPLTGREREVARLVALGMSNREIADKLVVSVRTVEGHIYRACVKLGVADRAALAAVVRAELENE